MLTELFNDLASNWESIHKKRDLGAAREPQSLQAKAVV